MTLPASGALATSDVNNETSRGTTTQTGIDWIRDNTKGNPTDYNSLHGLNYYQRNMDGNCNNGNCTPSLSEGNIQCQNCNQCNSINCNNCDGQAYLQTGTNCACSFNCDQWADQTYNCNCACACACFVCACACW